MTERLMKFADYQKEAGRKEFTISSYEPATNNTSAGYQAAAIETAKFWDGIRKQVEAKGLKLKVNLMIGGVNSDGYFLNDSPQDFIEGRKLKQTLKNNPALGGIEIVYNEPQKPHAPVGQLYEADKFQDVPDLQLGKDGKATISWAAAKTLNKVSDIQKREGGFADKYEADKANAPTERTV